MGRRVPSIRVASTLPNAKLEASVINSKGMAGSAKSTKTRQGALETSPFTFSNAAYSSSPQSPWFILSCQLSQGQHDSCIVFQVVTEKLHKPQE